MASKATARNTVLATRLALVAALACLPGSVAAQSDFVFGWDPRTGDAVLDARERAVDLAEVERADAQSRRMERDRRHGGRGEVAPDRPLKAGIAACGR